MLSGHRFRWSRRAAGAVLAGVVVASLASSPATGQTSECPTAYPTSALVDGMTGTGWTVAEDRTREQFTWEYLGTLEDALGPGRDMIIVDTSGPVIERHGGIFYGMSGSPLYFGDQLVGAIAFGLTWGPSSVAGVTPGEEIMRVLNYPVAPEDDPAPPARSVPVTSELRTEIAARTHSEPEDVGSFSRLRIPVGVSGVGPRGIDSITEVSRREGLRVIPHAASSASASQATADPPQPGDNLSAVLSYGDITFAGTGTTTVVCDGKFVAFGHPFFWEGETTFGAHGADTITVIEDPVFGSYELANVAEHFGRIDQDRLAGLRGLLGVEVNTVPITSTVSAPEVGVTRDGETRVVDQEPVPFLAWYHVFGNILMTMDEWSGGTSSGAFTINGVAADGTPWQLSRSNHYFSRWGIAYESAFELEVFLHTLLNNPFEDVEFTSVDADFTAHAKPNEYRIDDVLVSKDGVNYVDRWWVKAAPGSTLYLRVLLLPNGEEPHLPVDLTLEMPRRARGESVIEISPPNFYEEEVCFYRPRKCITATGDRVDTLQELIEILEAKPTNNTLRAQLRVGERRAARAEQVLDRVVTGRTRLKVRFGNSDSGGEATESGYEGKS